MCYNMYGDFMYAYIEGIIKEIESSYIVIDNEGIGYLIYTSNPYSFNIDSKYKVYVHQNIREDENTLYGFKTLEEKNLFLRLIEVKGLGCKMALPMFATGDVNEIINAIESENINYLKKFPKIGDKVARQIILDLKGKLISQEVNNIRNEELIETLKALGYKSSDINKVAKEIDNSLPIESQIKEALKLLLK